jgi:hypothetical protein
MNDQETGMSASSSFTGFRPRTVQALEPFLSNRTRSKYMLGVRRLEGAQFNLKRLVSRKVMIANPEDLPEK